MDRSKWLFCVAVAFVFVPNSVLLANSVEEDIVFEIIKVLGKALQLDEK